MVDLNVKALTDNPDMIQSETTEVNSKLDQIRTIYQTTSDDRLGFKHGKKKKKGITPGTWKSTSNGLAITIEAIQDLEININLPDRQEIITAITLLKNGKSPGQDNLNAELFEVDPELAAEILQSLFTSIWEGKIIPDDWTKGIHCKGIATSGWPKSNRNGEPLSLPYYIINMPLAYRAVSNIPNYRKH
ncbi:unnamed protein product [Mytilus edulis]|uniref:Uncharacterized protein n=1 Tax=Mytilus edulis TaxID=6550 RepID=A0A8S3RID1_MYTED|nr:unnamed protein product [Mytilus edulis]